MALEEYKALVGSIAGILTIGQMFSGIFVCKDIYNKGSTKNFPPTMFTGGFVIGILFLQHGLIIKDEAMGIVNFVGMALNIAYLLFYYFWSDSEGKVIFFKSLFKGIALVAVIIGYVQLENPEKIEFRFGIITTIFLFGLVSSPLFELKKIMATKSTEGLPFPMIFSGTLVSISWLLYGIIIQNEFVIFQNVVVFLLSVVQLSLFVIYPSKTKADSKKE